MTTPPKKTAQQIRKEQKENDKRMSELIEGQQASAPKAEKPPEKRGLRRKSS